MGSVKKKLKLILKDNSSGSSLILDRTISLFKEILDRQQDELIDIAKQIKDRHNQFMVLKHFLGEFRNAIEERGSADQRMQWIEDYQKRYQNTIPVIAENLIDRYDLSGKKVLVHSYSNTVCGVLKYLREKGVKFEIFQTESRPALEGQKQAEQFAKLDIKVNFFTEASISMIIDDVDVCLLGADVAFNKFVINKTGSYAIALFCLEKSIPIFILTDSRKVNHTSKEVEWENEAPKNPDEIWKHGLANIEIINYYFEKVPMNLIDAVITEKHS